MDEARAVVQAKLQNVVIKLARANLLEARRVNLDQKRKGLDLFTYVDINQPVGSNNKYRKHGLSNGRKDC